MKKLSQIFALGTYKIEKIECSRQDSDRLERLGIFEGEEITLIKNSRSDASLVIENMDANFVLDKEIARGIFV